MSSGSGCLKMPNITIDLWEGRSKEEKRKLIQKISKDVSETLNIPIEHIRVIINEVSKDNWGLEGKQASQIR